MYKTLGEILKYKSLRTLMGTPTGTGTLKGGTKLSVNHTAGHNDDNFRHI